MYFRVLSDLGHRVSGYVVPDNFDGHCDIVLQSGGREVAVRPANELRQDLSGLIAAGRHQTGACGFTIDEEVVSDLREMQDLEILDAETRILLYRRAHPDHLPKRVLRLESHLYPLWRLDAALNSRFQYSANRIDGFGHETVTQLFHPYETASVFISGRIFPDKYRSYIEQTFEVVFIMHHPLEELAERLILLSNIGPDSKDILNLRDKLSLRSAIEFAQSLPFHDEAKLLRRFREIDVECAQALANPVTRQLTASTPDEMPRKGSVSRALDVLASFAVVGLRRAPLVTAKALSEFAGVDAQDLPTLTGLPGVTVLAKTLKRTRAAEGLLDYDMELYNHISEAYKQAGLVKLGAA